MIDKILPRILNSSKDNRIKKNTEMNDALNVVVTDDYNDLNATTEGGNMGVIKPAKGNEAINVSGPLADLWDTDEAYDRRVLGSVSDPKAGVVYFFVYSENSSEMGVYAFDAYDYFGTGANTYRVIYRTSEFQFSAQARVVGDVVHVINDAALEEGREFRPILYFTDDENEPRRLDVLRCVEQGYNPIGFNDYGAGSAHNKDLITACPKTPLFAPTFEFFFEEGRPVSNFRRVPGLQFAFQCVYYSGEESALSTISDIAVPDEYLSQGIYNGALNLPQGIRIGIDSVVFGGYNFTREIEEIKILVREGNTGAFYVIDTVPFPENVALAGDAITYDFYNDRVLTGITTEEENKQFNAVPQVAQALSVCEDRLFFGNYIEGYDEPEVSANISAIYSDTPTAELLTLDVRLTPVVAPRDASFTANTDAVNTAHERSAGFTVDTSAVPASLPPDVEVVCNVSMLPAQNFDVYQGAERSYHTSQLVGSEGDYTDVGLQGMISMDNATRTFTTPPELGFENGIFLAEGELPLTGHNSGVGRNLVWRVDQDVDGNAQEIPVILGTSAAAPLRFKGQEISFGVILRTTQQISDAPTAVRQALCAALSGENEFIPIGFDLIQQNITPSYDYNLGFQDPTEEDGAATNALPTEVDVFRIKPTSTNTEDVEKASLIVPVFDNTDDAISGRLNGAWSYDQTPCGYFIINSAFLRFKLTHQPALGGVLTLELDQVGELDIRTCVPVLNYPDFGLNQWRVFSSEFVRTHNLTDIEVVSPFTGTGRELCSAHFIEGGSASALMPLESLPQRVSTIGWLASADTDSSSSVVAPTDLYVTPSVQRQELLDSVADPIDLFESPEEQRIGLNALGPSLIDGEAGFTMWQRPIESTIVLANNVGIGDDIIEITYNSEGMLVPGSRPIGRYGPIQIGRGTLNSNMVNSGNIPIPWENQGGSFSSFLISVYLSDENAFGIELNFQDGITRDEARVFFAPNQVYTEGYHENPNAVGVQFDGLDEEQRQEVEMNSDVGLQELETTGLYRSFKSSAYHDFGLVYYDERGRPGTVNRLPSVYVAGYSNEERGPKGRASISIDITSDPPDWAWYYQVVYGGNSTVRDFIQYTTGGAFKNVRNDNEAEGQIYVSLNYLQENDAVSYSKVWGAVHPDGTSDLYVYEPGDLLRIVSYYTNDTGITYPYDYTFEVTGQITTGSNAADHPLWEGGGNVPDHLVGQFLVLRDNVNASGFSYAAVAAANNQASTNSHNWNNRCVVEIIKPSKVQDPDLRSYREISRTYNVGQNPLGLYHQTTSIVLDNGDVWWRRVPVNFPEYDTDTFINLIEEPQTEDDITFQQRPRFRGVYMESRAFTDTFPGADVYGYGKPKFVAQDAGRVRRFSSVTYSDANDYSTRRVRFTSFNPYNAPFQDLPNEHGAINALVNVGNLFVVQEDKTSMLPINSSILSDAAGNDRLIASEKIVGKQKFFAGSFGADNNRESVVNVDGVVYFAHKSKGQVYRYAGGKLQVISDKGMSSFFRDAFEDEGNGPLVRVVGGYDPLNDEYVLSIVTVDQLADPVGISLYERLQLPIVDDGGVVNPPFQGDGVQDEVIEEEIAVEDDGGNPTGGTTDPENPPDTVA